MSPPLQTFLIRAPQGLDPNQALMVCRAHSNMLRAHPFILPWHHYLQYGC